MRKAILGLYLVCTFVAHYASARGAQAIIIHAKGLASVQSEFVYCDNASNHDCTLTIEL